MKALILVLTLFCIIVAFSQLGLATRILVAQPQMNMNESSALNQTQQYNHIKIAGTCSYLLKVYTSCNSPYDADDEVYVFIQDASGTQFTSQLQSAADMKFKPCMITRYRLKGGCLNKICGLSLQREGSDGWIPEKVTISDFNNPPIEFYFNQLIPDDGRNHGYNCEEEL